MIMKQYSYKIVCRSCGSAEGMMREDLDLSHLQCSSCGSVGTFIYIKGKGQGMSKRRKVQWKEDDRIVADFDGEPYPGSISELTKTKAKVLFDDGDVLDIKLKDLRRVQEGDTEEFTSKGFHQFNIKWDKYTVNFRFKAEGGEFYGWWRKMTIEGGGSAYGVDLHVKYKDKTYSVDTLHYTEEDPRTDLQSLNADLCAAANKWFYHKCEGSFDTVEELGQKAAKPTIRIGRLETLDKIILKLKEYRDTALRSGGYRVMTFTGDDPEKDPSMRIEMDLTSQALGLKGKIPSLAEGVVLDRVADDRSKGTKGRGKPAEVVADQKNVDLLVQKLKSSKDKAERRKIRATLRRLGHKGGARSSK